MPIARVWSLAEGTELSQQSVRNSLAEIHHWCNKGYLHVLWEARNFSSSVKKIVGFTLQAKLLSSKHLTQVHSKISSRILENLASHLMTKCTLEAQTVPVIFRFKISHSNHKFVCSSENHEVFETGKHFMYK